MRPLRDTLLLVERTDVGPVLGRVPRFKLVGKPGTIFFAEVVATGRNCRLPVGAVVILDAYDVAHSVPEGLLAPERAALAFITEPSDSIDPVPLGETIITEWRGHEGPGLIQPDGRRSDDVRDGVLKIHEEVVVALGPDVPRSDEVQRGERMLFGEGPDTPTLHWGGRRLRFVPWEGRPLAVR